MSRRTDTKRRRTIAQEPGGKPEGYLPAQPWETLPVALPDGRTAHVRASPGQLINVEKLWKKIKAGERPTMVESISEDGIKMKSRGKPIDR